MCVHRLAACVCRQLAGGSFFAVTTFFYLGGFLAVSLGARHLDKMIKKR